MQALPVLHGQVLRRSARRHRAHARHQHPAGYPQMIMSLEYVFSIEIEVVGDGGPAYGDW